MNDNEVLKEDDWVTKKLNELKNMQRPKRCAPNEHEWNNGGCNPEYCVKCGMSFIAHVFMECP